MSFVPGSKHIGGGLGVHERHESDALVPAGAEEPGQIHILDLTVGSEIIPDVVLSHTVRDLGDEQTAGLIIHLPWRRTSRAALGRWRGVGERSGRRHVRALAGTLLLTRNRPVNSNFLSRDVVDWGSQHLLTLTSIHEGDKRNSLVSVAARHSGHVAVAKLPEGPKIGANGILLQRGGDLGHEHADAGRHAALPRSGGRGGPVGGRRAHGSVGRSEAIHVGVTTLALATLLSPCGCAVHSHLLPSHQVDRLQQHLLPSTVVCIGYKTDPLMPCLPRDTRHIAIGELAESTEIRPEVVLIKVLGDLCHEDAESFSSHDGIGWFCELHVPSESENPQPPS
mmetsp:Transcript_23632/g.53830  ORF Transcript_23632/g.53830 Transcript_23632/m.53830 type:complete len:338 (+) Transcript_23632:335-1348(+)